MNTRKSSTTVVRKQKYERKREDAHPRTPKKIENARKPTTDNKSSPFTLQQRRRGQQKTSSEPINIGSRSTS